MTTEDQTTIDLLEREIAEGLLTKHEPDNNYSNNMQKLHFLDMGNPYTWEELEFSNGNEIFLKKSTLSLGQLVFLIVAPTVLWCGFAFDFERLLNGEVLITPNTASVIAIGTAIFLALFFLMAIGKFAVSPEGIALTHLLKNSALTQFTWEQARYVYITEIIFPDSPPQYRLSVLNDKGYRHHLDYGFDAEELREIGKHIVHFQSHDKKRLSLPYAPS